MQVTTEHVHMGTKAETLARLRPIVRCATILPLRYIDFDTWHADREAALDQILAEHWWTPALIVRSSASGEDAPGSSEAGRYLSIAQVHGRESLAAAIDAVFASYGTPSGRDQVLVQPHLSDIRATGVAASVDPSNSAPYRLINWSEGSDTTAVTSGRGVHIRTWYSVSESLDVRPPDEGIAAVIELIEELEKILNRPHFELEFGIRRDGSLVLFQVRPLTVLGQPVSSVRHTEALRQVAAHIASSQGERPKVLGRQTVFGVMPDWNPAEMIGRRPRPLALSLYKTLITDRVWAVARRAYGYRNVGATPLMTDFCGLPYIDVRASFTSLIPADLDDTLARRLASYYIKRLTEHPTFHDKVEFEIVLSCHSPSLKRRLDALAAANFSVADRRTIAGSLRRLTDHLISPQGPWVADLEGLEQLGVASAQAEARCPAGSFQRIAALLTACEQYGTLPFAGLARAGFVAVEFLNGLIEVGIISVEQKSRFMAELGNVTSVLIDEFHALSKEQFLARYGHLRPGTYDILSPRYDEQPDRYFDWSRRHERQTLVPHRFELSLQQKRDIDQLLQSMGLNCDSEQLFQFMASAIRGREEAKFAFTRNVSDILQNVQILGERLGFTPDDMSYVDIDLIRSLKDDADARRILAKEITLGRERYTLTRAITLPPLILDAKDTWSFELPETEPNFVTQRRCLAPVADIERGDSPEGAIAFIESADPGYDWLFARHIAGLVTAYGGCNSHMAIRALEFGIPAAIGVGETRFHTWRTASVLDLDASSRCVRTLP
jgi:phosphohistidine swiveling domain-containing protein